jgi:hypothetical protein
VRSPLAPAAVRAVRYARRWAGLLTLPCPAVVYGGAVCGLRIRIAVDFLIVSMIPELKPWHCERCGADVEDPRLITQHLVPGHEQPRSRLERRVRRPSWRLL